MQQFIVISLVALAIVGSQLQASCTANAKSVDHANIAEQHQRAKALHRRQREEALLAEKEAAAMAPPVTPNMWSILEQARKDGDTHGKSAAQKIPSDYALVQRHRHQKHRAHSGSSESWSQSNESSGKQPATNCPKCHRNDEQIAMTEEQLTELRIEFVKNQILKKLKLTERPKVSLSGIPRPVAEGATFQQEDVAAAEALKSQAEEYYAKTNQKIIFPQLDADQCQDPAAVGSSMCFRFSIPADIERQSIESAELWVYKQPHISDTNVAFVVGEVQTWNRNRLVKPIAIQESNNTELWVKIGIAGKMKTWIENADLTHLIDITCPTCKPHPSLDLLRLDNDYRPFIVVNTYSDRHAKRAKRNINCSAGVTSCCRDRLYISFAEIGWNDWILHPPGYDAYFCRGSCASAASITLSGSYYNSVLRKVMYSRTGKSNSLELVPCCSPTTFSSLQLFYMDSNNTATQKTLPNMVVEACGCT